MTDTTEYQYVNWRFRKNGRTYELEAALSARPDIYPEWLADSNLVILWGQDRPAGLLARWYESKRMPPEILNVLGDRMVHLIKSLMDQFPDHSCEGSLRIPDGDFTDLQAGWGRLGVKVGG